MSIQMVDLVGQYERIKDEIDSAMAEVVSSAMFVNGPAVKSFQANLESYLGVKHVIPCANGTDALQIALMALGLQPGDEVLVPAFTYVATTEVIALLGLKPVMIDVREDTFNTTAELIEASITPNTKAIVPVHLFGQSCDMAPIMEVARNHNLFVIEDNAQAIGADYTMPDGSTQKAGTIGDVGCTSFFPAKNLGCYGDGGAMFTNDDSVAEKLRIVANHGQTKQYYHDMIGVNSRLDSIQAAVLDVKLKYLDEYAAARNKVAEGYDTAFANIEEIETPAREKTSDHVFHQYTMKIGGGKRDDLKAFLNEKGIPANIYYPLPLYDQKAFAKYADSGFTLPATERLCRQVLSLPVHTEMTDEIQNQIIDGVKKFFG